MKSRLSYISEEESKLSLIKRCNLLSVNRSRVYYRKKPETQESMDTKDKIYRIWDNSKNVKGSRAITMDLREYGGMTINRKQVQRIMRELGIQGILPKSNFSKPGDLKYKHPYCLAGMNIYQPNMVWGTDLTYVKLPGGMMYITCLIDVFSRYIVSYVITNTLDTSGCIECLNNGLMTHEKPLILNSDQGAQYTSKEWVSVLNNQSIIISMDAKGRWADNIYVERFWRTLKYECIFASGIETVEQLHIEVAEYIEYYNNRRLHSALGYKTPASAYYGTYIEDSVVYCDYPPNTSRTKHFKQMVLPTVIQAAA